MLEVESVHSYYGRAHVLQGVTLTIPDGSVVALLGRNGMGKTTLIRSIMGNEPPSVRRGGIRYKDTELVGRASHQIAQLGIGLVPQGRRVFSSLTVVENLTVAMRAPLSGDGGREMWDLERVFELYPRLAERKRLLASQLSGGERQMLAIARALMTNPDLLLMDEPSEGLAPMLVQQLREQLEVLKEAGLSIFLVEQNLGLALALADEVYVLERGQGVFHGSPAELEASEDVKHQYLGV